MSAEKDRPERRAGRWARIVAIAAAVLLVVLVTAVAVPLVVTSSAGFFSRYHLLNRRYVNLEHSAHEGVGCRDCHETNAIVNGIQLTGDFYVSLFTKEPLPRYFKFSKPTNEACLACHAGDWNSKAGLIPHPAHERVATETRSCVGCHKWTAHLETYIAGHKTMPFSGVCVAYGCHVGTKQTSQCFDCHHVLRPDAANWKTEHPRIVRTFGENACLESCHKVAQCEQCHTTGKVPTFTGLTLETGMKAIEVLHVKPQWTPVYHGQEALKDQTRCLRCHQTKAYCTECHLQRPAFHGSPATWLGRHPKVAKNLDDPRCLECHQKAWCNTCHQKFKEMR